MFFSVCPPLTNPNQRTKSTNVKTKQVPDVWPPVYVSLRSPLQRAHNLQPTLQPNFRPRLGPLLPSPGVWLPYRLRPRRPSRRYDRVPIHQDARVPPPTGQTE
jgi:hypothetical protein